MSTHTIVPSGSRVSSASGQKPRERLVRLSQELKKLKSNGHIDPVMWAGTQPWFRKQGLATAEDIVSKKRTVIYKDYVGWEAIEEFFELLPLQAEFLFSANMVKEKSPKEIARSIDNLLRKIV